jgi:hypothetical protein
MTALDEKDANCANGPEDVRIAGSGTGMLVRRGRVSVEFAARG